jgi:signal transduction histidine kinase
MRLSLHFTLTVGVIIAAFITISQLELRRDLSEQVRLGVISGSNMERACREALAEQLLIAMGMVGVFFGSGYLFVRKTLAPVGEMTRTATQITAKDLSMRISAGNEGDEMGELAATLNNMIAGLERSFDQIRRFSGDAAHELCTPLTALRGEIEVALLKDRPPSEYRAILARLNDSTAKLAGIVDNLLFLSLIECEEGCAGPAPGECQLDQVVLECYEESLPAAAAGSVHVDLERLDEAGCVAEPALLKRLVSNVLSNAVKFTLPGGAVTVRLENRGAGAVLSVRDTGIGIPAEHLPHIFERFYRVEKSRSASTGGSGLGLAIASEIARLYGVAIQVQSRPGEGTMVAMTFKTTPAGSNPPHRITSSG